MPRKSAGEMTNEELSRCRVVGNRLRYAITGFIGALPGETPSIRVAAEYLSINRNVAQRAFRAVRMDLDAAAVVKEVPGAAAIKRMIAAGAKAGIDAGVLKDLEGACTDFELLIRDLGGSQKGVSRRLDMSLNSVPEEKDPLLRARKDRFGVDAQLVGASDDVHFVLLVVRPAPGKPGLIERVEVRGCFGHRGSKGGMPLFGAFEVDSATQGEVGQPQALDVFVGNGVTTSLLLREFTSSPLPTVTVTSTDGLGMHILDSPLISQGRSTDVFSGCKTQTLSASPMGDCKGEQAFPVSLYFPAKELVFDVWLHEDIASEVVPFCGQYVMGPNVTQSLSDRWYDLMPATTEVVSVTAESTSSPCHPRIGDLIEYAIETAGWDVNKFSGFRYSEPYPLVGVDHIVGFKWDEGASEAE